MSMYSLSSTSVIVLSCSCIFYERFNSICMTHYTNKSGRDDFILNFLDSYEMYANFFLIHLIAVINIVFCKHREILNQNGEMLL